MKPLQLLALLRDNLKTQAALKPVLRPPGRPSRDKSYTHNFYDVSHLSALTQELLNLGSGYDYNEKYGVRYLVETNGRIVFAREGRPGKYIPGHKQISTRCLAAGNIYFNEDYSKIVKINHESGDFHPGIETLVHPLAILLATVPHILGRSLDVEVRLVPNSNPEIITFNKVDLTACVQENFGEAVLRNTPWESIKTDTVIDRSLLSFKRKAQSDSTHCKKARRFDPSVAVFEVQPTPRQSKGLFFSPAPLLEADKQGVVESPNGELELLKITK